VNLPLRWSGPAGFAISGRSSKVIHYLIHRVRVFLIGLFSRHEPLLVPFSSRDACIPQHTKLKYITRPPVCKGVEAKTNKVIRISANLFAFRRHFIYFGASRTVYRLKHVYNEVLLAYLQMNAKIPAFAVSIPRDLRPMFLSHYINSI